MSSTSAQPARAEAPAMHIDVPLIITAPIDTPAVDHWRERHQGQEAAR